MAIDLTPEQREIGKANFQRVVGQYGVNRRDFMKGLIAAGGGAAAVSAAAYYGYKKLDGAPIKTGLIGAGDEGGVLIGEHNPEYLQFVAYSDIRPTNQKRVFDGEATGPRKGFNRIYGKDAAKQITLYEDYKKLLERPDIQAVVIALPLHLHAQASIDAMKAGKHVLCEKLMAWNVKQCKEMIKVADQTDRILSIGHQRHYSLLYAHAWEVLQAGELGDIKHIRALWHRNNSFPKLDKDNKPIIDVRTGKPMLRDGWRPEIQADDAKALEGRLNQFAGGYRSTEELVRWRLFNRTGGGLMAELGSHQLDACSIFLGKIHPLAVSGIGTKSFYLDEYHADPPGREVEDHVFVTFEFPGPKYAQGDKNDIVVVTYSSINTNSFEPYGECVMGTRGTMVVESEQNIMLYPEKGAPGGGRSMSVTVTKSGMTAVDSSATTGPAERKAVDAGAAALGTVSRGYREEMEHFAYCVKMWEDKSVAKKDRPWPRCHGRVAMADAIIALTSNIAMRGTSKNGRRPERIAFKDAWFDAASDEVPDAEAVES